MSERLFLQTASVVRRSFGSLAVALVALALADGATSSAARAQAGLDMFRDEPYVEQWVNQQLELEKQHYRGGWSIEVITSQGRTEDGHKNRANDYAHSMAWFGECLYVGLNRAWLQTLGASLSGDGPPDINGLQAGMMDWAEFLRAKIIRYCPDGAGTIEDVYQSDVTQIDGQYFPNEHAFREMIVVDGEICAFNGLGYVPGRLVICSTDGKTWTPVLTPLEMGSDARAVAVHNGVLYVGPGPGNIPPFPLTTANQATVWERTESTGSVDDWTKVASFNGLDHPPGNHAFTSALASFAGKLYAGTLNDQGFQILRSKGSTPMEGDWVTVVDHGAGDQANLIPGTFHVLGDFLYHGTINLPIGVVLAQQLGAPIEVVLSYLKPAELIRIHPDDTYQLVVGNVVPNIPPPNGPTTRRPLSGIPAGFFNILNFYIWSMATAPCTGCGQGSLLGPDQVLLAGTWDASTLVRDEIIQLANQLGLSQEVIDLLPFGADLWVSRNGRTFFPLDLRGQGDFNNYGIRDMVVHGDDVYLAWANPKRGFGIGVLRFHDYD